MSKLASIITAVLLGTTGIAAAAPAETYAPPPAAHVEAQPDVRQEYRPEYRPGPVMTWTNLGSARLGNGSQRTTLDVSSRQRFNKLELVANRGSMEIKRVTVVFADGSQQVIREHASLEKGCSPLTIDLAGRSRRIDKVIVQGSGSGWRSSYSVLAI